MASPRADSYSATSGVTVRGGRRAPYVLTHLGPATPEQISLYLPVDASLPMSATATCRYRQVGTGTWKQGHPLYRIRHDLFGVPEFGGPIASAFAWPIIDLLPGTSYNVEVTVANGGAGDVCTLTHTTRALPPAAGAPNKTANSVATIASQLAALNPGDVLQIADGTYGLTTALQVTRSGTAENPIYIRGQSRAGTILSHSALNSFFAWQTVQHVIFENMTLAGCAVDGSGTTGFTVAFNGRNDNYTQNYLTVRNIIATGIDMFVYSTNAAQGMLVYDNTATGNNLWNATFLGTNLTWDDDGIHLPGSGNCGFQNTMTGFGDTFAYCSGGNQGAATANSVHFYRNELRNSLDDSIEVDDARANCTWYDNRVINGNNADSLDPLVGGPWLSARNVYLNLFKGRPHKWNNHNSGHFLYNNTILQTTTGSADYVDTVAAWYQPNNGTQESFGYQNNLHVYRGSAAKIYWLESPGRTIVDWTNNSWFPDLPMTLGSYDYANLATAKASINAAAPTTPVFSGQVRKLADDNITTSNPWTETITLGATSSVAVTGTYRPVLADGSAPRNSGMVIPGVTDGYSGALPDRGAAIAGRAAPVYGDQTAVQPAWLTGLALNTWTQIGANVITDVNPANDPAINPNHPNTPAWATLSNLSDMANQWNGGALDDVRGVMWVAGGGHAGYLGNEVYSIDLEADSPVWARRGYPSGSIQKPCANLQVNGANSSLLTDGRPHQVHTYNLLATDAAGNLLMGPTGYTWAGTAAGFGYKFNAVTNDWDATVSFAKYGAAASAACVCYDPINNKFWGLQDRAVVSWHPDTGVQTYHFGASLGGVTGYYSRLLYDSNRNIVVVFPYQTPDGAQAGASVVYFDAANPTQYFTAPQSVAQFLGWGLAGVSFDAVADKYVAWNGTTMTMTTVTPPASGYSVNTWVHEAVSLTGTPSAKSSNGTYGRFQVSNKYGCVLLLNSTTQKLWALRIR